MNPLQINALVGTYVFGYQVSFQPRFLGDQAIHPYTESPPYYLNAIEREQFSGRWFLPAWSVDLDKALQVVQVMNGRGFNFELKHEPWGHWVAGFGHHLADMVFGDSDLPATSICAAALAVFCVEVEENRISVRGMQRVKKEGVGR